MAFESLKQILYPKALRITDLGESIGVADLDLLQKLVTELATTSGEDHAAGTGSVDPMLWRDLATEVWRLEKRVKILTPELEARKLKRMMAPLSKLLEDNDVSFEDYTGTVFDPEEIWDEVFGDENSQNPLIGDMSRPRVTFSGQVLQRGSPVITNGDKI